MSHDELFVPTVVVVRDKEQSFGGQVSIYNKEVQHGEQKLQKRGLPLRLC